MNQNASSSPTLRRSLARATRELRGRWGLVKPETPPPSSGGVIPTGLAEISVETGLVHGWIENQDGVSEVQILLNGRVLATTFPGRPVALGEGVQNIGFARSLKSVLPMLGKGDRIGVAYAGRTIPIVGQGLTWLAPLEKKSHSRKILTLLGGGYVVNKYGKVRKNIRDNIGYTDWVFETCEDMRRQIREILGYEAFPFYGSMLGAIREKDFIGHDNDFDMLYVSKHSTKEDVLSEYYSLCKELISRGYWLRVKKTHIWIRKRNSAYKIDLFFGWFDQNDFLQISNGYHHDPVHRSVGLTEFQPHEMAGRTVMLPTGSVAMLEQLYGPTWRTPDRGFKHRSPTLRVDKSYWLNATRIQDLYWKQFYRDHPQITVSRFADWVSQKLQGTEPIIEIGCGSGGDAVFLAKAGHPVMAVDKEPQAVALTQAHAQKQAISARVSTAIVDAADPDALDQLFAHADPAAPPVLYLRFFLHAVPVVSRKPLFERLPALPLGSRIALEFRTREDAPEKRGRFPARWYTSPESIVSRLEAAGYIIEAMEIGRGFSPRLKDDPHLARILARKVS